METEADWRDTATSPGTWESHELGEAGRSSPRALVGSAALSSPDFRLLALNRDYRVVICCPVCGHLLRQTQGTQGDSHPEEALPQCVLESWSRALPKGHVSP